MAAVRDPEFEPVITGIGVVSSIGDGVEPFWRSLLAGVDGARPVRCWAGAPNPLRNTIACEIDDGVLDGALTEDLTRASALGARAAAEALATARADREAVDALCVGTTMGDLPDIEEALASGTDQEYVARVSSRSFGERIARAIGVEAPASTVGTSCSAGNLAIFRGAALVRSGRARCVVAGGADAFSKLAFIGFARMRAMAPARCTPFAADRKGILLGEGAGFVTIEARGWAERRNAPIYAVIAGYGLSCDAHHISTPAPNGRGAAVAMAAALEDAALAPASIDYVAAHGTGTAHNDTAEARACGTVFGQHRPYVSSLKALIGHTLGAASAIQAIACALSIRHQRIVPAWHVEAQDPACDVLLPRPGEIDERPIRAVISNGFAFGGNNSCLVLRSPQ